MPEHEDDDGEGGGRRGRKGVREAAAVVNTRQVNRVETVANTKESSFFKYETERLRGRYSPRNSTNSIVYPMCLVIKNLRRLLDWIQPPAADLLIVCVFHT